MKPPPLPRPRAYVQELPIGSPPVLTPEMDAKMRAINDGTVRELQATFPQPDGRPWGVPTITAIRILFWNALERVAKYQKLECIEEARQRAAQRTLSGGLYPEDEI